MRAATATLSCGGPFLILVPRHWLMAAILVLLAATAVAQTANRSQRIDPQATLDYGRMLNAFGGAPSAAGSGKWDDPGKLPGAKAAEAQKWDLSGASAAGRDRWVVDPGTLQRGPLINTSDERWRRDGKLTGIEVRRRF